jgi:GntR family transcriptional regulator
MVSRLSDGDYAWSGTLDRMPEDPRAYVRIADEIRRMISDGKLTSGMPVPSITSLTQQHGVARATAAHALRTLEAEGLLARYQGLGYYVV